MKLSIEESIVKYGKVKLFHKWGVSDVFKKIFFQYKRFFLHEYKKKCSEISVSNEYF